MNSPGSLDPKTLSALKEYANPTQPLENKRLLLKLEKDEEGHLYLRAVYEKDLGFFERLTLFFHGEYKLQSLAEFFESKSFSLPDPQDYASVQTALKKLDGKIQKHNDSIFSRTVELQTETLSKLFTVKLLHSQIEALSRQLVALEDQLKLPLASTDEGVLQKIETELVEIAPFVESLNSPSLKHRLRILEFAAAQKRKELDKKTAEQVRVPRNSHTITISPIQSDKNCLLRSVACGLFLVGAYPKEMGNPHLAASEFRAIAAAFISSHYSTDDEIKQLVNSAISEYNKALEVKVNEEKANLQAMLDIAGSEETVLLEDLDALEKDYAEAKITEEPADIAKFVALSQEESFEMSAVHLYALSRHFQVNIEVHQVVKKGTHSSWQELPFIPRLEGAKGTIQLQYDPQGPHFNVRRPKNVTIALPDAPSDSVEERVSTRQAKAPGRAIDNKLKERFGCGLVNRSNACYVNSIVQGLRFVPSFRDFLKKVTDSQLAPILKQAYNSVEGTKHKPQAEFELDKKKFRELAIGLSSDRWLAENGTTQEDAGLFLKFLLNHLKIPIVGLQAKVNYTSDFRIVTLERQTGELELNLGENPEGTTLQGLIANSHIKEECDLKAVLYSHLRHDFRLTEDEFIKYVVKLEEIIGPEKSTEILALLPEIERLSLAESDLQKQVAIRDEGVRRLETIFETVKDKLVAHPIVIDTHQTLSIDPARGVPQILPFTVKRYGFSLARGPKKDFKKIMPPATVTVAVAGDPTKSIAYKLKAVVVHHGDSVKSGHYFTYVPTVVDGKEVWIEYNDTHVRLHDGKVLDDILRNGYVHIYERVSE